VDTNTLLQIFEKIIDEEHLKSNNSDEPLPMVLDEELIALTIQELFELAVNYTGSREVSMRWYRRLHDCFIDLLKVKGHLVFKVNKQ
jgi:hypothetical protein